MAHPGFKTDCHGTTFAEGEYWIDDPQANKILKGDSYKKVTSPQAGDVAIYTDERGNIVHSVTVTRVDDDGTVWVTGLAGLETEVTTQKVEDAWKDGDVTYYRKYKEVKQESPLDEKSLREKDYGADPFR